MASVGRGTIVLAMLALPAALISGYWLNDSMRAHAFYNTHPLLKEMDETVRRGGSSVNPSLVRRSIVLNHVPLGSPRSEAISRMTSEGLRLIQLDLDDESLVEVNVFPLK
jgi:hypothetical protein